ncbi:hypothetical protein [Paenibacillus thalictri]|uniref:Uncharacterized protein n=1 Tax=Paenibacillus thalictri TaxID=2527873 RepID=A0A4Q9DSC1_9BACL|nr:hypothetical protein [Paenibacillus thalictri]TBL79777.1 hypothetical protein EYB31_09235 [Paenibacillus thalictri]
MKMGAFVVGGLLGATAVVAFQKYRGSMMAMSSTSDSFGKIVEKGMHMVSKNKAENYKSAAASGDAKTNFSSADSKSSKSGGSDFSEVEKIVKQDPSVKQQVDEILSENAHSSSSYQSH